METLPQTNAAANSSQRAAYRCPSLQACMRTEPVCSHATMLLGEALRESSTTSLARASASAESHPRVSGIWAQRPLDHSPNYQLHGVIVSIKCSVNDDDVATLPRTARATLELVINPVRICCRKRSIVDVTPVRKVLQPLRN